MSASKPVARKKSRRSSDLVFNAIMIPDMIADHTVINRATSNVCNPEPSIEERQAHPYNYYDIYSSASNWLPGYEPYNAFKHILGKGWRTTINDIVQSWIAIEPGEIWRKPDGDWEPNTKPYRSMKLEVFNPILPGKSARSFIFQGRNDIDWVDLKVCKIDKADPGYKSAYHINMPDDYDGGFKEYRLLITDTYGTEEVGFSSINLYAVMHHNDVAFGYFSVGENRRPIYNEKLAYFNDEGGCDGIIWEKKHDKDIIITGGSYSYNYSSYSDTVLIHPKEKHISTMLPIKMSTSLQMMTRTKDYAICQSNYYNYWGNYDPAGRPIWVSPDGVHWKRTDGIYTEDGYISTWSLKENIGLVFGLAPRDSRLSDRYQYQINKLEILEDGSVEQTYLGHYKIDFPEDIIFCGDVMLHDDGDGTEFYSAWDHDGNKYTSSLKRWYYWNDHGTPRSDVFRYTFKMMGGKYCALVKRIIGNTTTSYTAYTFEAYISDDGFKTGTWYDFAGPPWSDGSDWNYDLIYFDEKWMCYRYSDRNRWYYLRDYGKTIGTSYTDRQLLKYSKFDIQGNASNHNQNVQRLVYYIGNSPSISSGEMLIGGNGYQYPKPNEITGRSPCLYFKNGKIADPYGYMVKAIDFNFGNYDADYETFLLFEGDFTHEPKEKMCFTGKNLVIDPGNGSWPHYW